MKWIPITWVFKLTATTSPRFRIGLTSNSIAPSSMMDLRYDVNAVTKTANNNGITRSSGLVTVAWTGHGITNPANVTISGASGCTLSPNGTFQIFSIPNVNSFTYKQAGVDDLTPCGGAAIAVSIPADTHFWFEQGTVATGVMVVDSGVAVDTTFHTITVASPVPGTVVYQLDSGTPAVITANEPVAVRFVNPVLGVNAGGAALAFYLDYFGFMWWLL